jgi:hypothetical protein
VSAESARPPELSFVVETVNLRTEGAFGSLDAALGSIRSQTIGRDRFEVLVVVDPRRQPALAGHLRARAPDVRVVDAPQAHYYAQKNAGARAARGEIVGFVDADCELAPTWAESVLEVFARGDAAIAAVVGAYDTDASDRSAWAQVFLVTTFGHQAARSERPIPSLAASNCAFRRAELLETPFDEDPFFHGPDVRLAAKIAASGRRILLVPGAANRHDHDPGLGAMHARGRYWGYCFLSLRQRGDLDVPYGRLFRALGPLAPAAIVPAKLWIDWKRLGERRRDLHLGPLQVAKCAGLMALNAVSAGAGAARVTLGLAPPTAPQHSRWA